MRTTPYHPSLDDQYDDFMMAVTIFVLFGDDVRILYFPPSADDGFAFFVGLSFILFFLEMVLHCWAKSDFSKGIFKVKGYAFSFFFWLDLLAVLSMVPDVPWLASGLGIQDDVIDSLGEYCFWQGLGTNLRLHRIHDACCDKLKARGLEKRAK